MQKMEDEDKDSTARRSVWRTQTMACPCESKKVCQYQADEEDEHLPRRIGGCRRWSMKTRIVLLAGVYGGHRQWHVRVKATKSVNIRLMKRMNTYPDVSEDAEDGV